MKKSPEINTGSITYFEEQLQEFIRSLFFINNNVKIIKQRKWMRYNQILI